MSPKKDPVVFAVTRSTLNRWAGTTWRFATAVILLTAPAIVFPHLPLPDLTESITTESMHLIAISIWIKKYLK